MRHVLLRGPVMAEQHVERLRELAVSVVRRLTAEGFRALFAGGCVRDQILGRVPKDYDVATSARTEDVQRIFPRTVPVGAAFGVVQVLEEGPAPLHVEVATFRRDGDYSDGRHPDAVEFAGEKEDVKRRDFTINGLLYDPLRDEVVDHVGGREDLARRVVRAIGDPRTRFREDRLRLLRAVRFAAGLGFEIDGLTFAALKRESAHVTEVSAERIRDELAKMLTGPDPRRAFELLHAARLLKEVLPEVAAMDGVPQPPEFHPEGDVWIHTRLMLGKLDHASLTLALGVLLHDVGKPPTLVRADRLRFNEHEEVGATMAETILRRLRFPNDVIESVVELIRRHMAFKDVRRMRPARLKRFLRMPQFDEHLELHRLDCLASHGDLTCHEFCRTQLAELGAEALRPPPLLTGEDLKALGLVPGPLFGQILTDVEDRQLEGTLADHTAALDYVRRTYAGGG
jgi:putative nucleotidyltransferase with HDIG domain